MNDDDASRRTPYELVFGDDAFERQHFPAVARELETRPHAATDPAAFVMLGTVGHVLRALRPDAEDDRDVSGEAVMHYGALAFQGFHFWHAERPLFVVTPELFDHLMSETAPIGEWPLQPPAAAGYVQLPRHRLWIAGQAGETPEAVDGFFWTSPSDESGLPARLDVVLCAGLRPGRPGFAAYEIAAPLPAEPPGHWADLDARENGRDFENVLPGGELGGLHALTNAAEALKLLSRVFHAITSNP
jgi:hypothetical protein